MATFDAQHAAAFDWLLSSTGPARRQHDLPGNEPRRISICGSWSFMGTSRCTKADAAAAGEKTPTRAQQGASDNPAGTHYGGRHGRNECNATAKHIQTAVVRPCWIVRRT